jgi:hypothetical protein
MKQTMKSFILLLTLTTALAGCSGGGSDAPAGATSSLTKTVVLSGPLGFADEPFGNNSGSLRSMMLFTAAEINGAGTISAISFIYDATTSTAVSCPNTTIKMSHTNLSALNASANFADNINTGQGSQQTVFSTGTVNIPAGTGGTWYTITLSTPFYYNGVDNLVVDIARGACSGTVHTRQHVGGGSNITLDASGVAPTNGILETWRPDTRFNLSGGDSSIMYTDDGTIGALNSYPFQLSSKIQLLYTAAEINGSGIITGFAFPVGTNPRGNPTVTGSALVTIKLGHTSLTGLTTNFANNFNSGAPVTVANARTVTIPAGIPDGDYVWVPLPDGAFNYNGTDNLVVEIESSAITGSTEWINDAISGVNTRLDALGGIGATTGTLGTAQYFIKFRFAGGPIDFITGDSASDVNPFSNSATGSIRQVLYRSAELGAKGTITKIAHRIHGDANVASYGNFTVNLANTDITAVGTNFSTNMTGGTAVYTGTYTISATLKAGDWIEIPLSTPFVIDPAKNLIVQMSTHTGTASNATRGSIDATRYPSRRVYNADDTAATGTVSDQLFDLRLIMQ